MSRSSSAAALAGLRTKPARPQAVAICLLAAITVGGCQSTRKPSQEWVMRAVGAPVAPAVAVYVPKPEVEADGMEAQAPPPLRRRDAPDDPSEPFSPNYGSVRPRMPVAAPEEMLPPPAPPASARPSLPQDLPPRFRKRLAAALAR